MEFINKYLCHFIFRCFVLPNGYFSGPERVSQDIDSFHLFSLNTESIDIEASGQGV
jgi:hypothetical protein